MFSREELRNAIKKIVEDNSLDLFDVDFPTVTVPTLRVYIWSAPGNDRNVSADKDNRREKGGVTLDQCAVVSRAINSWLENSQIEGSEQWMLEVSSPGINRRLRLKEHFESAIGERVKLKLKLDQLSNDNSFFKSNRSEKASILAVVSQVIGSDLLLALEPDVVKDKKKKHKAKTKVLDATRSESAEILRIPFSAIEEARVDFIF